MGDMSASTLEKDESQPEAVVDTALQDTDDIATWLATTAKRYGFSSDLLTGSSKVPAQEKGNKQLLTWNCLVVAVSSHGYDVCRPRLKSIG